MSLKLPVLLTLAIVGATGAFIVLKSPQTPANQAANYLARPGKLLLGTTNDTLAAASSPFLKPSPGHQTPPIGDFVYLFDVSASTKNADPHSAFDEGIALLRPMFDALRGLDELMPQRHRVTTIGAMSLRATPRCDIYVSSRTLFTATDSLAPMRAMQACADSLRAAPAEPYTDISGALLYAGLSLQGDWKAVRGIVLVSDLNQDQAPGTTSGRADLRGICVAAYTVITPDVERNPQLLEQRQNEWKAKLTNWGAQRVRIQNALSFDGNDLQAFFRTCEGR